MAWCSALQAALLLFPTCSAISFIRMASETAAAEPQPAASEESQKPEAECQEVKVGTPCHESVDWLRRYGLSKNPEWYPGYTSESTFEEVQDLLHGLGKVNCPKPCFVKKPLADNCQDVAEGGCYDSILWLKRYGLDRHPDWYPSLQPSSSVAEIQAELHRTGKGSCPQPCALTKTGLEQTADEAKPETAQAAPGEPTEQCMDAKPNTPCYSAVIYGINEGISKYPHMYEGFTADEGLDFKRVQEYLYLQARPSQAPCGRPCPTEKVDMETLVNHPENLRVKKRVEDMSMGELSDFFSGKWDGYVSKMVVGDWQPSSTTFEKRLYDPTTTVPEYQLPDYKLPLPEVFEDSSEMGLAPVEAANGTEKTEAANDTVLEEASKALPLPEVDDDSSEMSTAPVEAANGTENTEAANDSVLEAASNDAAETAAAPLEAVNGTENTEAANDSMLEAASKDVAETAAAPVDAANGTEKTEEAIDTVVEETATAPVETASTAPVEAANVTEHEEAANDTALEESSNVAAEVANVSQEAVVQDDNAVDEPTPEVDNPLVQDEDIVDEPAPEIDGHGQELETREEMEQRIRKQLMDEMQLQTTTAPLHRETEEEMRQRLKDELMREMMPKGQ